MQMFRYIYSLSLLLLFTVAANAVEKQDLDGALDRLDSVIDAAPHYEAVKLSRIASLKKEVKATKDNAVRYGLNMQIYEEYRSYENDSAISVLQRNYSIAKSLKRKDLEGEMLSLIAFQCSTAGHYPDAKFFLNKVNVNDLSQRGKFYYYRALNHLYGEMAYYSHIKAFKDSSNALAGKYDAEMLKYLNPKTAEYKQYLCRSLFNAGNFKAALKVCNEWEKMVPDTSRNYAMVAYYQYIIRINMKDVENAMYWVAMSAICDISHAVMDQASLWSLADYISGRDIDRSYKYIRFSWECATKFGTSVRSAQISPILSVIESEYKTKLDNANLRLSIFASLITILAIVLFFMLYYVTKQRRKLAAARNDLKQRNGELAESNDKLKDANERVIAVNEQLHESDQIKEAYIGRFLKLCSGYVDRLDKERKTANRLIKSHKIDELYQITRSTEQKDKDLEDLFGYFDSTFLNIFPTFVDEFNELLKPENRIETEPGKLNTTLRIFALIRLGIDDSSKIASFLHYSVNTIYNYRARTKNGCLGDRDSFEDEVKKLGKIPTA